MNIKYIVSKYMIFQGYVIIISLHDNLIEPNLKIK